MAVQGTIRFVLELDDVVIPPQTPPTIFFSQQPYQYQIQAIGGNTPYTFRKISGHQAFTVSQAGLVGFQTADPSLAGPLDLVVEVAGA